MDWFPYDKDFCHERVEGKVFKENNTHAQMENTTHFKGQYKVSD